MTWPLLMLALFVACAGVLAAMNDGENNNGKR